MSVVLSTAVLLVGQEINGSKRWLSLGPLSFQPSELAKVAVILFLAWQIDRSRKKTSGIWFMCRTMATLLPIVGLVGSNNLSTAIIILGIGVILIFVSSPGYVQFVGMGSAGVAFITVFLAAESYRLERLAIWRNPEKSEKGFQTIQGLYAIGSGGLFGRGLGSSLQKLGFVPEAQNDMIFSIICEELGLVGAGILIIIFALLLWRLCVTAMHSRDLQGTLILSLIHIFVFFLTVISVAVLFCCVNYLQLRADITGRIKDVAVLESELSELREENNAYESQVNSSVDLNRIKKIAIGRLGMNYPREDQKKTYSMSNNSYVRQYQDVPDK